MEEWGLLRLGLGAVATFGGAALARYWIKKRNIQRAWYTQVFEELKTAEKQNAAFLSNVSHELRTPINMVIGISEVALGEELPPNIREDMASIKMAGKRLSNQINNMTEFVPKPIERTVLERVLRKVLPKDCIRYSARPARKAEPVSSPEAAPAEEEPKAPSEEAARGAETPALSLPEDTGPAIPYDRLAQAGVNVDLGLDYCAGDEDFYREMLRMFCAQGAEKRAEIISLYESADWTDYAIKVHALKSTSLTIGAQALSAQAKELELAGKRGDTGYIQAHHAALMCAYEALCAQIAGQ